MSKDLHHQIIDFFVARMSEHSRVDSCIDISDGNNYIFKITRHGGLPAVTVHLSDAYTYTLHEYIGRPAILRKGDYILVARPEASFRPELAKTAKDDGLGLGKIGDLMGALNARVPAEYRRKTESERRKFPKRRT